MRYFFQRPLRGGETNALHAALGDGFEPLEREGQVRAALGGDDGVDLVDDHGVHLAQAGGGVRGQQQVERLRRGDENFGGMAAEVARSFCDVSPVRTLISGWWTSTPAWRAIFAIPASGERRLRSTSTARALSGLI